VELKELPADEEFNDKKIFSSIILILFNQYSISSFI